MSDTQYVTAKVPTYRSNPTPDCLSPNHDAMAEHVDAMDALQDVGAFDREAQDAAEARAYHEWLDRNDLTHSDEAYDQYTEYLEGFHP
jgi:hypothetical protein